MCSWPECFLWNQVVNSLFALAECIGDALVYVPCARAFVYFMINKIFVHRSKKKISVCIGCYGLYKLAISSDRLLLYCFILGLWVVKWLQSCVSLIVKFLWMIGEFECHYQHDRWHIYIHLFMVHSSLYVCLFC